MLFSSSITSHSQIHERLKNNQTTDEENFQYLWAFKVVEKRLKNIKMKQCTKTIFDKILKNEWMVSIGILA